MPRRYLLLGAAALGGGLVLGRGAEAGPLEEALARIEQARAKLRTLQGPFRQTRVIGLLATEVESRGRLTLVRPERLRWELEPPDAVTYWVGPEGFAMATADGVVKVGKAAAGRFGAVLEDLLVLLGGDVRKLRDRYVLEVVKREAALSLSARPRADTNAEVAKHVAELRMELGPQLWSVQSTAITERNGDHSLIAFGKLERDIPVPPEHMKPPSKR